MTGSLDLANLEADTRAKLEHALRSEFETHDRWRGSQSKGLPPAALFLDVVYGVGLNRATEVVRTVLGAEWSP